MKTKPNKPHNLLIRSVHCLKKIKTSLTFGSSGTKLFCCLSRCNCPNGETNCIGFSYCKESLMLQSCKIYHEIRHFRTKQITENLHTCSLKQLCYIPVLTCWCLLSADIPFVSIKIKIYTHFCHFKNNTLKSFAMPLLSNWKTAGSWDIHILQTFFWKKIKDIIINTKKQQKMYS